MIVDLGYRRLVRPLLFRSGGGDPERVHESTLTMISRVGEHPWARATEGLEEPVPTVSAAPSALAGADR